MPLTATRRRLTGDGQVIDGDGGPTKGRRQRGRDRPTARRRLAGNREVRDGGGRVIDGGWNIRRRSAICRRCRVGYPSTHVGVPRGSVKSVLSGKATSPQQGPSPSATGRSRGGFELAIVRLAAERFHHCTVRSRAVQHPGLSQTRAEGSTSDCGARADAQGPQDRGWNTRPRWSRQGSMGHR